jgi:cyclopropane fatty-acyl-phospholipid synthase-like methyltransferase
MNISRKLFFYIKYFSRPVWDTGITPPELVAFVDGHPAGRALDLGCGTGTNAIYLAQNGWRVTGVDFVGQAIRLARKKARHAGVDATFLHQDVTCPKDLSGSFDLILDIGCLHSLRPAKKRVYANRVLDLLAQQGCFLLYAFVKPDEEEGRGLDQQDLTLFDQHLERIERIDGTDRDRTSAWFCWRRSRNPYSPA